MNSYLTDPSSWQVGNWSKFLTDTFSVNNNADYTNEQKWFNLLSSLSHLLMVPKDMLMDRSIRAEVCHLSHS